MFSLAEPIRARLQSLPALAGWTIRLAIETGSRRASPAAELSCESAAPVDARKPGALLEVVWAVSLIVPQDATAAATLNTAFGEVFGALHGWLPGEQGGRRWERLRIISAAPPPEFEAREPGLVEYRLTFSTSARFDGQQ